jgi:hypothetical protein
LEEPAAMERELSFRLNVPGHALSLLARLGFVVETAGIYT